MAAPGWNAETTLYRSSVQYVGAMLTAGLPLGGLAIGETGLLRRCGGRELFGTSPCALGEDCCYGVCTRLGTDEYCATCSNHCGPNERCCFNSYANWYLCGRIHTPENCGACGHECPHGAVCCPPGLGDSRWHCADLYHDNRNCGECNRACPFPTDGCCYNDARK